MDAEKVFDKILTIMITTLNKLEIELPQQNKGMYVKLKANITLCGEGLKAFSLRLGIRQGCPFCYLIAQY